jgi:hypothetical protein
MKRALMYTGGLMFAAAASLALAGPASAAPKAPAPSWFNIPNYQYLGQSAVTTQTTLNNIGNPQIGFGNYNGGGSANSVSSTSVIGGNWSHLF